MITNHVIMVCILKKLLILPTLSRNLTKEERHEMRRDKKRIWIKEYRRQKRYSNIEKHFDVGSKITTNCSNPEVTLSKARNQIAGFKIPKKKVHHENKLIQTKFGLKNPIVRPKHRPCECNICIKKYKSRLLL